MLFNFTEVSNDDIIKIVMDLANKQSVLDAIPCSLFKELLPVLLPSLNAVLNDSLREGVFPTVIKMAIITPVLKSKQLDPDVLNNYSNLNKLSKIFKMLPKTDH